MKKRSGRRPGNQDTRGTILAVAREAFAQRGYDKASIRQIAADAGVDPALVHHYFGSKEKLFQSVIQLPFDPDELIPKVLSSEVDQVAENLVRTFLAVWEGPVSGPAVAGVLRSAASHRRAAALMRELFAAQIVRRHSKMLEDRIDPKELPLRVSLVASQLFGLALTRYILKIEPLATADPEVVVASVSPSIHRYFFGDLPQI